MNTVPLLDVQSVSQAFRKPDGDQLVVLEGAAGIGKTRLLQAARDHSANMARNSRLDHFLEGKSPSDRARAAGYASSGVAENIAWNQQSPTEVLKSWMSSSGHRANILNRGYTEIGIAVAVNSRGERYWTQVFGQSR